MQDSMILKNIELDIGVVSVSISRSEVELYLETSTTSIDRTISGH